MYGIWNSRNRRFWNKERQLWKLLTIYTVGCNSVHDIVWCEFQLLLFCAVQEHPKGTFHGGGQDIFPHHPDIGGDTVCKSDEHHVKYVGCPATCAFQVASIITTTGYASADFDQWSQTCKTVLVILMFVGACAGSTGGGMKVSRLVIMFKTVVKELSSYFHPKNIKKINMDGKPVEHEVVRAVNVYFITLMGIFTLSVFLVSLEGRDLVTNFTAVASCLNNIGPGLSEVGPTRNFGGLTGFTKYVLMFDMLAGRLELFPLLLIFNPGVYRDMIMGAWRGIKRRRQERRAN